MKFVMNLIWSHGKEIIITSCTCAENSFNLAKHCSACMIISFSKSSCLHDLNTPITQGCRTHAHITSLANGLLQ